MLGPNLFSGVEEKNGVSSNNINCWWIAFFSSHARAVIGYGELKENTFWKVFSRPCGKFSLFLSLFSGLFGNQLFSRARTKPGFELWSRSPFRLAWTVRWTSQAAFPPGFGGKRDWGESERVKNECVNMGQARSANEGNWELLSFPFFLATAFRESVLILFSIMSMARAKGDEAALVYISDSCLRLPCFRVNASKYQSQIKSRWTAKTRLQVNKRACLKMAK